MTKLFSLSQLPPGHMHLVKSGDHDILLSNVGGKVYAVHNKCSHYGAPLSDGAMCEHRVRCPWHHAVFDLRTGEQIEAPGMDGLATFDVEVRGDDIFVADHPTPRAGVPECSIIIGGDSGHYAYLIVGAGVAAAYAVQSIREIDSEGSILLLGAEELPPYDRTKVSKAFMENDMATDKLPLRSAAFYAGHGVEFRAGTRVQTVDLNAKQVTTESGQTYTYGKVLMATGGRPRELEVPGADLDGIHTIRRAEDGRAARDAAGKGSRVVVVGGSFIGLECAMSLGNRGAEITVVSQEEVLFEKVFGEQIGKFIRQLHEAAGVKFMLGRTCASFSGTGRVSAVVLDNGETLEADLVVVGIGVEPVTEYVKGIALQADHSLSVDGHLAIHGSGAYAAGDLATYPDREGTVRIEHWKVAGQQGRIAGRNMAGRKVPYSMLPYFWSNQQGTNLRYVGHGKDYDGIVMDGQPGEGPFLAFYVKDEHVQACLGVKRDTDTAAIGELLSIGKMPKPDSLIGRDWVGLCRS